MTITARALALRKSQDLYASLDTVKMLQAEIVAARSQYPDNVGLLERAKLQGELLAGYFSDPAIDETECLHACIVMACLALRLCEEGTAEYGFRGVKNSAVMEQALDQFHKELKL